MEIVFKPIGIINSPFKEPMNVPIQPAASKAKGVVTVYDEFKEGMKDIEGFSHIYLIYYFHRAKPFSLTVKPYMDTVNRGLFATRAPSRPNNIGLSVVEIEKVDGNKIYVKNLDILDDTPLLDIKPYTPKFDIFEVKKFGWLEKNIHKLDKVRADKRFGMD